MGTVIRSLIGAFAASLAAAGGLVLAADHVDEYDVVFFASDGPAVLRFRLESAGVGIETVRQRYAAVLLDTMDADGDGRLREAEARKLPVSGRLSGGAALLEDGWSAVDAAPADGTISLTELAAWLDPLLGERFSVRRKPPLLAQSVQLHPRLDLDGDGQISRHEIDRAAETLRQFDFDDDGTFSPAELQPFPQSMLDASMTSELESDGGEFLVLGEASPYETLAERLIATYGDGSPAGGDGPPTGVKKDRLPWPESVFHAGDRNGDGVLDAGELAAVLRQSQPDAEIAVDLRRRRVTLLRTPRGSTRVEQLPSELGNRLVLRLGEETVEFSAADNRYQAADQISLLRIEFRRQDSDRNGYLSPQEFAMLGSVGGSFSDVDLNGDGQVVPDELDRFIRLDAYLAQCYAELTVDAIERPLFQILDENVDRRLTLREFAGAVGRMQPYDLDQDGRLDTTELLALRKYRVALSFGVPPAVRIDRQNQMTAERRMPITRPVTSGPEWFRLMDRNQDGELTWREFLGPRAAFDRLDRDGGGWIDVAEAETH